MPIESLIKTVIEGDFCIGCGGCASIENSPFEMKMDEFGKYKAVLKQAALNVYNEVDFEKVCPFSNKSLNEEQIGKRLFGTQATFDSNIGYNLANFAGYVREGEFRENGSSGGFGTWLAAELFKQRLVDGVLHIHQQEPTEGDKRLFKYGISTSIDGVLSGAKSRYYPVELSEIMDVLRRHNGKFAVVGLPCFIKSIRLLVEYDNTLKDKIAFCIGLVCGHLKSARFADILGWQVGVHPKNLKKFNFRSKLSDSNANRYGIAATKVENGNETEVISPPVNNLYGTNWGYGFFKYKACDYCDDVMAETADVVVGDAWLPKYIMDSEGTNILVVRHPLILNLLEQAAASERIFLESIEPQDVYQSQKSSFEHRRAGLAYRLKVSDDNGKWRPNKRVNPSDNFSKKFKNKHQIRMKMVALSHIAAKKALDDDSYHVFEKMMMPLSRKYDKLIQGSLWARILRKILRITKKII